MNAYVSTVSLETEAEKQEASAGGGSRHACITSSDHKGKSTLILPQLEAGNHAGDGTYLR